MEKLTGKTLVDLQQTAKELGMPAYTAKQIATWLYKKKVCSTAEMTDISLSNRQKMETRFTIGRNDPIRTQTSKDGTRKYLFDTGEGRAVETVYIPDRKRATLCVSSQAGCKMNCSFCMTGRQGFSGQLTSADIINQVLSVPETDLLTNIVFMGMGEPFDNTDEVFRSLEILTSDWGFGWSPKRVTVSTVGLVPGLKRFLNESQCHLAVSVHSPFPVERLKLIPAEKAYPIAATIDLLKQYDFSHQRRVSFEYIMFGGLNDDTEHAAALARMLRGLECRVNLIRYHSGGNSDLQPSDEERMTVFRDFLSTRGITSTIRASRGEDILAACGQLSGEKGQK